MGKAVVTKFRWFWTWQDEAEEIWLEKMSQKGYHLSSVGLPGFYTFLVAEPRNYVYRLDYQTFRKKDKQAYLQLFKDAGWEHIGEMSAWQYFRKEARVGEINEIFTDVQSKVTKYKRVFPLVGFSCLMLILILSSYVFRPYTYPWWGNVQIIVLAVLLLLIFALIKIALRIRQLKSSK
jgi:hypothetical protein